MTAYHLQFNFPRYRPLCLENTYMYVNGKFLFIIAYHVYSSSHSSETNHVVSCTPSVLHRFCIPNFRQFIAIQANIFVLFVPAHDRAAPPVGDAGGAPRDACIPGPDAGPTAPPHALH